MSGPSCKTCNHYRPMPLGDHEHGECGDPAKRIYYKYGGPVNDAPETLPSNECCRHTGLLPEQGESHE